MKLRHWVIAVALASVALSLGRHALTPANGSAQEFLPPPKLRAPEFIGAGSCSASACHNSTFTHLLTGSEYAHWVTRDPHARAYEVLFEPRSRDIQKKLDRSTPAHEERQCLQCHVAPGYDDRQPPARSKHFKTDGVSCESCHGAASGWINLHHLDDWQLRSPDEKKRLGMNDTRSLVGRAQVCVTCHVGAPGMDVNHDLIAAGHPRLHFEFAAFHAYLPRHWSDAKDRRDRPNFEAQAWAIGRLATAKAALDLLADRADPKQKIWPEFAEHDCAACHHDLSAKPPAAGQHRLGSLPWSHHAGLTESAVRSLNAAGDEQLFDALRAIHASFDTGKPNRELIAKNARSAAKRLDPWLRDMERQRLDADWLHWLSRHALKADPATARSLDHSTEHLLAAIAIARGSVDAAAPVMPAEQLDDYQRRLSLSRAIPFAPLSVRERIAGFNRIIPWKAP